MLIDLNKKSLQLVDQEDYRVFLKQALGFLGFGGQRINYAAFSRKAGFSSRSYPRDVVVGKRRITAQSLPKFIRGMGLRGDLKTYFVFLVSLHQDDLNTTHLSKADIQQQLKKIRQRLQAKAVPSTAPLLSLAKFKYWQEVFASLGDPEKGATLADIAARAQLATAQCQTILAEMCASGCVEYLSETDRYRGIALNLNLEGLGKELFFKNHLQSRLQKINRNIGVDLNSPDWLVFDSVWSVQKQRLPEFKQEFRKLILQFIETTEEAEGDSLAHVFVSLGPLLN